MLHHCRAVARGSKIAFKIGDMPFGSYEVSLQEAVKNAISFINQGNMEVSNATCVALNKRIDVDSHL
jgi:3-methyl-2-oxobutanoate hydroxymethyltransferase